MLLEVTLSTAFACLNWLGDLSPTPGYKYCVPVLVGKASTPTPTGRYKAQLVSSGNADYGPDVLYFHSDKTGYYLVHRPWKGSVKGPEYRAELLKHAPAKRHMTNGCININADFFDKWAPHITEVVIKD